MKQVMRKLLAMLMVLMMLCSSLPIEAIAEAAQSAAEGAPEAAPQGAPEVAPEAASEGAQPVIHDELIGEIGTSQSVQTNALPGIMSIANDLTPQTVYVYIAVKGDFNSVIGTETGWETNDYWGTTWAVVGRINNVQLPNIQNWTQLSGKDYASTYGESNLKALLRSSLIKWTKSNGQVPNGLNDLMTNFIDDINVNYDGSGSSYGLYGCSGAQGYSDSGTVWHLDLYLDVTAYASLDIEKTVTNDNNGTKVFNEGETVEFEITVTNKGNQILNNVYVTDELSGATILSDGTDYTVQSDGRALISSMHHGDVVKIKASYVVQKDDLGKGTINNFANAKPASWDSDRRVRDYASFKVANNTTTVTVTKVWQDGGESVSHGDVIATLTVDGASQGERPFGSFARWTNVPISETNNYAVKENAVDGYSSTVSGPTQSGDGTISFTITNTRTNNDFSFSGTKTWVDGGKEHNNANEVNLTLKRNSAAPGSSEETVNDATPTWTDNNYTYSSLPEFDANGYKYTYTVEETAPAGYTSVQEGAYNFKNTINTINEKTSVTGTKTWIDGGKEHNNATEVTLTLSRTSANPNGGGEAENFEATPEWNGENNATYTFSNLPKYDAEGYEYTYSVAETAPQGYTSANDGKGNFTNTVNTINDTIDVTGTKTWIDGGKEHNNATELTLTLSRTSAKAGSTAETVEATATWSGNTYTFAGVAKYDAEGYEYTYSVAEAAVTGYTTDQDGNNFTNTMDGIDAKINVTGTKTWVDGGKEHNNTTELTLTLSRTSAKAGSTAETVEGATATWSGDTYTFAGVAKYDAEGYEYTYSVAEAAVNGYTMTSEGNNFTNTRSDIEDKLTLTINKVWEDANDQDGVRPESVTIELQQNNKKQDVVLTAANAVEGDANKWSTTIEVPKYDSETGAAYTYSIEELKIDNYSSNVTADGTTFTVTNSYTPATFGKVVTVRKVWDDLNNKDGMRPESVVVQLQQNGKNYGSAVTLSAANNWTYTWNELPAKKLKGSASENTEDAIYTVVETTVPEKYTAVTTENETSGAINFTITNTHGVPDMQVSKRNTEPNRAFNVGEVVHFQIMVQNTGNVDLTDVSWKDVLLSDPNVEPDPDDLNGAQLGSGTIDSIPRYGDSGWIDVYYTVTAEDIAKGRIVNSVTATADGELKSVALAQAKTAAAAPSLKVEKTVSTITYKNMFGDQVQRDLPAAAELNDVITYSITVTNNGNVTVSDITVTDPLTELEQSVGELAPNQSAEVITTTYTVTADDILAGKIDNTATATGTDPAGTEVSGSDVETVATGEAKPGMKVHKDIYSIVDKDGNPKTVGEEPEVDLGDQIVYHVWVENTGNLTLNNIFVIDSMTKDTWTYDDSLEPGKTTTLWTSKPYTVTEEDIMRPLEVGSKHEVTNVATATAVASNGKHLNGEGKVSADVPLKAAALTVDKTAVEPTSNLKLGDTVNYTITVTNTGNVTVKSVSVVDEETNLRRSIGDLAPGASETLTTSHEITEADILAGSFVNTATATGTDPAGETVTGKDDETVTTVEQAPALTVEKTASAENTPAKLGDTITYTITVTNSGNVTVSGITVIDTKISSTSWLIPSLAPNQSKELTGTYTVTEADILAGMIVNVATAMGTDPKDNPVSGSDTETVTDEPDPDDPDKPVIDTPKGALTVVKTASGKSPAKLGDTITYTVTVKNTGNVTVSGITVTDPKTGMNETIESLAPDESKEFTTTYTVTEADILAGEIVNVATAAGTDPNGEPVTDSDTETITDEPGEPDPDDPDKPVIDTPNGKLTVVKRVSGTTNSGFKLGDTVKYIVHVTNSGNVTVSDITVKDDKTGGSWTIDSLAPGETQNFTTEYVVTEADILAGKIVNIATAEGKDPNGDDVSGMDSVTVTPAKPNGHLTITKTTTSEPAEGAAYGLGETITYSITATNDGNLTLTDITVTDALTGDEWTIESLAPGASETFTAEYVVTEADILAGSVVNEATATGKSPDPENPDVPVTPGEKEDPTKKPEPSLHVDKKETSKPANGTAYDLGETVEYTITVTNNGNVTLTNVFVLDSKTGMHTTIGSLAPGESEELTTTYIVKEADILAGEIVNTARAVGSDPTGKSVPGEDTETVLTAAKAPALTVTKRVTSSLEGYDLGSTVTYHITVKNTGNLTLNNVDLTDELTHNQFRALVAGGLIPTNLPDSLAPGEEFDVFTQYVVTEADIKEGSIENTAKATATASNGAPVEGEGSITVTTVDENPALTSTKTLTNSGSGANGAFKAGETATFDITVTNTGNVTQENVTVTETLSGAKIVKGEGYDVVNGEAVIKSLAPGETVTVKAEYTVTQDDIDNQTKLANTATVGGGTDPDPEQPDPEPIPTEEEQLGLTVEKSADKTSDLTLGETVTYTITVTNTGNTTLTLTEVKDSQTGLYDWSSENVLAPNGTVTYTTKHVITEADIIAGEFVNTATATGKAVSGKSVTAEDDETVTTVALDPKLSVTKTIVGGKNDGFALGDTITYHVVVENTGNLTVNNITVTDELTGDNWTIASLKPGEKSETFTATYTVTEEDILNIQHDESIVNTAVATGTAANGATVTVQDAVRAIPVDPNGHLTITKTTTSEPENGETYALGETITYEITATNDGNLTLTNITVTDELTGDSWTIESLEPGDSETFTAEYVVTEADVLAGSVKNVATGTGTSPDPDEPDVPVEPGEKEDPTEDPNGHLTITKTTTSTPAEGAAYGLGETITYEITATNDGNLTLTEITVTDALTGDTWTIESLEPGESETFTAEYTVLEKDILAGSVRNVATGTGTSPDPQQPNVPVTPGEDKEPTQAQTPMLTVVKTATSLPANGTAYVLGEKVTYTITVTNNGNVTVTDIDVVDPQTGYRINIASMAPGAKYELTTTHRITEEDILAGSFVNTAAATGKDPNGDEVTDDDDETVTTEAKDGHLTITKTTTSTPANGTTYELGETITYSIVAENDGNLTLTDITVTDELTGDSWTIASLAPGAKSETFTASYVVTEADVLAGKVVNEATAKGTSPDPDEPEVPVKPGEKEDPTEPKDGHLTITKTTTSEPADGEAYVLGETITYSIVAENDGNLTLTDITVTDELTGDEWTIESLEPGDSETFEASYVVTEADVLAGSVVNVATGTGTSPDPDEPDVPVDPGEKEDPTEAPNGHLTIAKTTTSAPANGEAYVLGETITYEITVTNDGNLTVRDITVTDDLTGDTWNTFMVAQGEGVFNMPNTLKPGDSVTFTAEYVVTEADVLAGSVVNEATATGTSDDPNEPEVPVEPGDTEDPTEPKDGHLTITKTTTSEPENGETYALGETITYEITAENDGNLTLTDITVTDELTGDEWTIESLEPGKSETFTAEYVVTEADVLAGSVVNVATAKGTSPDPDEPEVPVDPGEKEDPTDPKEGHLTITKETTSEPENGETYALGETITYEIIAENDGNLTLTDITVTDELTGDSWTIESLEPGKSETFTAEYVVTEADVLAGSVVNVATGTGTSPDPDEPDVPVDPGEKEDPTDPKDGHLTITKTTTSTPEPAEDGTAKTTYGLGETITYEITAKNDGNLTLTDITVTDELTGDSWTIESLEPGKSETFTAEYVVTEADVLAGSVVNVATGTGTSPDPDEPDVPVDPGEKEDPTDPKEGHLTITKETTSTPAPAEDGTPGTAYGLGEEITYSITAVNDGNLTLTDITVTDELTGDSWTIESLEPGDSETFTASHVVTEDDILAGSVVNVATATGTSPDPDKPDVPVDPGEKEDPTQTPGPSLFVEKTANKTSGATLGEEITYTITVTNNGNVTVNNIIVTDPLTGLEESIGTLAPGEEANVNTTHTITEDDILAGSFVNTATATGTDPNGNEVTDSGNATVSTAAKNGHVTITKETTSTPAPAEDGTAKTTYGLGETITYEITAENDGNLTLTDITVTDELTGDSWTIESLEPGASETFTTSHVVTEADVLAGSVVNVATATGTSPDPDEPEVPVDPGEEEVPTDPKNGHVTITKTVTSTPAPAEDGTARTAYGLGEEITYSITAENDGNLTVTNVVVTDELTGDSWTIESLEPGASETFTTSHVVTEADVLAGSVVNVATATGTSPDPDEPEVPVDPGEEEVPTDPKNGHVTITKTVTSTPAPAEDGTPRTAYGLGETITYEITAENDGNLTLTNVVVTDELTGDSWTIESLEPGDSETFTTSYVVTEADVLAGSVVNVATATGTSPDPDEPEVPVDPGEEEVPTDPKNGHVTITKTVTSTPANGESYALGETITYSITAENDGNLTLTNVVVTDELTGDSWTIESLEPGASETFTTSYVVTEADVLAGSVVNVATATGTSPDPDEPEVPVDPGEEEVPTDPKNGHVTITKTVTSTPANGESYALGETITYSITAENDGNLTLTNITVTDELTGDTWTITSLEPGDSETFTAEYIVTEADVMAGSVVNVATATGTSPDPDEPDVPVDPGEEEVPTEPLNGHVTITKTTTSTPANGTAYDLGETITYSITATNDGNLTVTNVTVTDELTGDTWTIESLEPGASETFTTSHVVTEADVLAGSVVNVATATGTSPDPDEPDVPVDPGEVEVPTQSYTLTVRYWYGAVDGPVAAPTFTGTYYPGAYYYVASPAIDGYAADLTVVQGTMPNGDLVYDVIYTPVTFTLTVNYVYQDGTLAAPQVVELHNMGDIYNIVSPAIPGFNASLAVVGGTMPGYDLQFTVIYVPAGVVPVIPAPPAPAPDGGDGADGADGADGVDGANAANVPVDILIDEYGIPLNIGNVTMNVGDCFE